MGVARGNYKGGQEAAAPSEMSAPCGPKQVQDKVATCQNYILTNEFACVYVFII